jgi:hypothetical protein
VEAFVDGELSPDVMAQFEEALAVGVGGEDVLLARSIRNGLHALPQPVLRPEVSRFVLEQVRADGREQRRGWLQQFVEREWAGLLQPTLAMAMLLLFVFSAVLVGRPPVQQENISQAEVEQALAEAKWALAYISHVGKETGSSVRSDVLEAHVVQPVRHALSAALNEQPETELR